MSFLTNLAKTQKGSKPINDLNINFLDFFLKINNTNVLKLISNHAICYFYSHFTPVYASRFFNKTLNFHFLMGGKSQFLTEGPWDPS